MKKRYLSILLAGLMACSAFLSGCGAEEASDDGPIIIGHQSSTTGTGAKWGQAEVKAIDMYVEKLNAEGGINGRQVEVIHYDNKSDQAEAVNVCKRLISDGAIAMIGPSQSGNAIACSSICEEEQIPLITTTGTSELLTVPEGSDEALQYIFRVCFIDPYQGSVAATFAHDDLSCVNAAILTDVGSDYSTYLGKYFHDTFTELGGEVVAEESFRSEELEYKAQLAKIKELDPDVLYLPTTHTQGALAMKQARELGMDCVFIGCDNWPTEELFEIAGTAAEGAYIINSASLADPMLADFVEEYREKYNEDPVMPNPAFAVDAIMLLEDAITEVGTDPTAIADWLENAKDVEVLTGIFTNDPATHNPIGKNAVIEQVNGTEFEYVTTVAASVSDAE